MAVEMNGNSNVNVAVPITPSEIPLPSKYVKLGLTTGYNPKAAEDIRLYVTGLTGEGKSTFIRSIPNAWCIDFEGGDDAVISGKGAYFDLHKMARKTSRSKFNIYREIITGLIEDGKAGKHPCRRVIFDTHDEWVAFEARQLATDKLVEHIGEYGQHGHGWSLVHARCQKVLGDLENAGYTWAVVGHLGYFTQMNPITNNETTVIRPLLAKGSVGPVVRKAEMHITVYASTKKETIKTKQEIAGKMITNKTEKEVTRYHIYTRPTEAKAMEGKRRGVPQLPGKIEIPMVGGWDVLREAYNKAVEESKKTNNIQ